MKYDFNCDVKGCLCIDDLPWKNYRICGHHWLQLKKRTKLEFETYHYDNKGGLAGHERHKESNKQ